jgi:catechol 2,3-dioxygenase-like lactoylglutathione lyase family enzyme
VQINRIDHLVLTVADIDRTVDFYSRALGMEKIEFGEGRIALSCGEQKINLHQLGREFEPRAATEMSEHINRYKEARDCSWSVIVDNRIDEQCYQARF